MRRNADLGKKGNEKCTGVIRAKSGERNSSCIPAPLSPRLSLALIFPKDIVHVDSKARWLVVLPAGTSKPLIFIISILIVVCIPVSLFLGLGAGLPVVVIVPLSCSFLLCHPSLKSHDLRQVWVIFPMLCRP